ncbi:acyl carrier protein [Helicobacter cholecystus]|uniref:acyl carrier protein n=1 Tax=Helicobacter cholecystus TaxID=45498 RepID=UPI00273831CD|nr:acyl carrier protein [Helicobacter cholecystus]
MEEKIQNIIIEALKNLADELENAQLQNPHTMTGIYGVEGNLDSLALVSFITDVEEKVDEEFNTHITLADEKAMSSRNSPFKDVGTLTQYIHNLLQENQ